MREVREETGFRCIAEQELPEVRYIDHRGRDRWIRYWMMQAVRGEFQPNSEVDQIRWTPIVLVGDLLTHEHELDVVSGLRLVRADIA
jgi:8-oxo-dGTP diphosphatase